MNANTSTITNQLKKEDRKHTDEELRRASQVFREVFNLNSRDDFRKFDREFMDEYRTLLYYLSDDPDDEESPKRLERSYDAQMMMKTLKNLLDKYYEIYHMLSCIHWWDQALKEE